MMAITTRSSINVKPFGFCRDLFIESTFDEDHRPEKNKK